MNQEIIKGRVSYPTHSEMGIWMLGTLRHSTITDGVSSGFDVLIRLKLADFNISSGGSHVLYVLDRDPHLVGAMLCYLYEHTRNQCEQREVPDTVLLAHHAKFMQLAKDLGMPDDWAEECRFGERSSFERVIMSNDARLHRIRASTILVAKSLNCVEVDRARQGWLMLEIARGLGMVVTNDYSEMMAEAAKIYNESGENKLRKFFIDNSRKDDRIDRTGFDHLVEFFFMTLAIRQKS